jgi:predicted transposase YbfD/YdcC
MQPCQKDNRSFFEKLQDAEGLDLRDKRGKRHDLAVVLVGVGVAVLSNRDGSLSSIRRHLASHYENLTRALGVEKKQPVSRSQLPRILGKVAVAVFDDLLFSHFGIKLAENERKWFASDGKELRGSIATGAKRGEAVVQVVAHENRQTVAQDYYCGEKESEQVIVRKLLKENGLLGQKISLDALHCQVKTLELIASEKGKYLVGLKNNQKELLGQVITASHNQARLAHISQTEKGHGRIESRSYEFYDLLEIEKAGRWKNCEIRTAIKVKRAREEVKTGKKSLETSYYVSNEVGKYEEIAEAIRRHWQVETNNHQRDVTLQEDGMRTQEKVISRVMAEIRTLATTILNGLNCQNKKAQLEHFADDFGALIVTLNAFNFL